MVNGNSNNHIINASSGTIPREESSPTAASGGTTGGGGSKIGLAWKRLNSNQDEETLSDKEVFSNTKKLIQSRSRSYMPVDLADSWTQTDIPPQPPVMARKCCCDCHKLAGNNDRA
jgi:hypothetical protein